MIGRMIKESEENATSKKESKGKQRKGQKAVVKTRRCSPGTSKKSCPLIFLTGKARFSRSKTVDPKILVLISALVKRLGVSRMRDFFRCLSIKFWWPHTSSGKS